MERMAARRWMPLLAAVGLLAPALCEGFEVRLEVVEPAGLARRFEVVSVGVPLPPGKVADVKALRLLDEEGKELYAEFRPLAFYTWRPAKSVRWVEVTFAVNLPAGGRKEVRLRDDGPAMVPPPRRPSWRVMHTRKGVVVITGGARFEVNRQFTLFTRAWMDADRDGRVTREERIIEESLNHGGVARDALGRRYTTSFGEQDLEVLRSDELLCVVRVKGTHHSSEPGAFRKGFQGLYDYEATLTFRRGRPWVWVDYVIKNSPPKPRGSPVMQDYSLVTRLRMGGKVSGRVLAEKPYDFPLARGQGVVLYQDSDGTDNWQDKPAPPVRTDRQEQFRGFRLFVGPVGRERLRAEGNQAEGFVEVGDARWGMMAGLIDFWQTYPKAVEIDGTGRVVFHLFPDRARKVHWLEDQSHVGHRLVYGLFARRRRRVSLEEFARAVKQPAYVRIPRAYARELGALHDLGPCRMEEVALPPVEAVLAARAAERAKNREYGWQVFGSAWSKRNGPPAGDYDPLRDTDTLFRYVMSGERGWFDLGLRRARHMRDVRAYHVDGVDPFEDYPDLARARSVLPVGGGRRPFEPGPGLSAFLAGRRPRGRWVLPAEPWISLDELYNLYLLTGDRKSLEAAREVAAAARAYLAAVPEGDLRPGRAVAMCLRALVKYHELAGHQDPRALDDVRRLARRLKGVLAPCRAAARADSPGKPVTPEESALLLRALAMAYTVTGDEEVLDLAIGTGDWLTEFAVTPTGFGASCPAGNEFKPRAERLNPGEKPGTRGWYTVASLEPLAWLYAHTGQRRYLETAKSVEPFVGPAVRAASTSLLPYYYHVAKDLDRVDAVPPAAVEDLEARPQGRGAVLLTWTAPGDNGREGTADHYQVKYARRPIAEVPRLPDEEATHIAWWSADNVEGEPRPARAGTRQSMRVAGLAPGTYYFALRTWDEAPNLSPISNVVKVTVE